MLALSSFGNNNNGRDSEIEGLSMDSDDFDFASENFLNSIDFDDLFMGFGNGDDLLSDLEIEPETFPEFSVSAFQDESGINFSPNSSSGNEEENKAAVSVSDLGSGISGSSHSEEIVSKVSEPVVVKASCKNGDKGRKSLAHQSKKSSGKKKVKVDWTPELHRRFVQAVEQLGVDKAVPSRILEIMGLDSLTRHNIASHLQKYRSHRRHLLAREAEAASWTHKRQMYASVPSARSGQKPLEKKVIRPWIAPTMGFPHGPPPMPHHFRPLHVWGHPSVDQSFLHMWPKHLTPPPPPHPYAWPPVQHPLFFPAPTRYPITPKVPAASPMSSAVPSPRPTRTMPQSSSDVYPSKESVDAAIGDILSKPWQPLPLGLKPPSIDTVMLELQSQGISKIPPSCA